MIYLSIILDSSKLSSSCLTWLLEKCLYLESVSTSRCYNIQPSSYLMLAQRWQKMAFIRNFILLLICTNFSPTLLYLNVFGLLREQALNELKERLKGKRTKLQYLIFWFLNIFQHFQGLKLTNSCSLLWPDQLWASRELPSGIWEFETRPELVNEC